MNERVKVVKVAKVVKVEKVKVFQVFQNIPGSQLLSDLQTFFCLVNSDSPARLVNGRTLIFQVRRTAEL